jgi:hypothetical protein
LTDKAESLLQSTIPSRSHLLRPVNGLLVVVGCPGEFGLVFFWGILKKGAAEGLLGCSRAGVHNPGQILRLTGRFGNIVLLAGFQNLNK